MRKLKCVVVDDDAMLLQMVQDLCENSPIAEIVNCFTSPKEFLKLAPTLQFDLCLLDIYMPDIEGIAVAKLLKDKPIIFITGADNRLKDALDMAPIDILTKPIKKERFDKALAKAHLLIYENKEYALFNIADNKGKMKLKLVDIYHICVDETDPRNKKVTMKDGNAYTLMGYTFEDLLDLSPALEQVSKYELVCIDAVESIQYDIVTLKRNAANKQLIRVVLSTAFKRTFMDRFNSR